MEINLIFSSIEKIKDIININKEEIEKLDQEIGDGDHIFNIQRGIKEALNLKNDLPDNESAQEVLKKIGMKIMTTVGGSSGALFATLLIGMSKNYNYNLNSKQNLAHMFIKGVEAMKKRGKADLGEKTMLDVLIPVSKTLYELQNESNNKIIAEKIKKIAENGMLSTKDLVASKGRASFLGERAKGHIDPGARSSQLAIEAVCNQFI
ncbi:MAG: dihydroxyacetone kinase subunit L [Rickettsiales bacterium]|nr:dihydroxyacetone kinase subunit L [Rickettsiales bacterium]